jgi:hypothetical protein
MDRTQNQAVQSRVVSSFIAVFDEFDAWEFYQLCVERIGDRAYCKEVAKLVLDVQAGRPYAYGRFHVVLPNYRRIAVAVDGERRSVVVYLDVVIRVELDVPEGEQQPDVVGGRYVVVLIYEKHGSFRLKSVDWITPEVRAMKNPHPSAFFRRK